MAVGSTRGEMGPSGQRRRSAHFLLQPNEHEHDDSGETREREQGDVGHDLIAVELQGMRRSRYVDSRATRQSYIVLYRSAWASRLEAQYELIATP